MFVQLFVRRKITPVLLIASIVVGAISIVSILRFRSTYSQLLESVEQRAQQETARAAWELDDFMIMLIPLVQKTAQAIENMETLDKAKITKLLEQKPIEVFGLGVAFLPDAFEDKKLFAPYYFESGGKQELTEINTLYDYTKADYEWFHTPLKRGPGFIEPYFGEASKTVVAEYAMPIFRTDEKGQKKAIGVVFANQSIAHLNHVLSTLYLGPTGYWFVLSKDGRFLAHPRRELSFGQRNAIKLAQKAGDTTLENALKEATAGKSVFISYNNEITKAPSWLICEPVTSTGWSLCRVFDKTEISIPSDIASQQLPDFTRQNLMLISLYVTIALTLTMCWILSFLTITPLLLWIWSFLISALFVVQIGYLWRITDRFPDYKEELSVTRNKPELYEFLKLSPRATPLETREQQEEAKKEAAKAKDVAEETRRPTYFSQKELGQLVYRYEKATYLPTGIFISHIKFVSENRVDIVGYVWQQYFDGVHDALSRGFILPQATSATIRELYNRQAGGTQTIIWQFEATLNQSLIYASYPFDVKDLQIQIWHKDFDKNIILVPDFDSYRLINPNANPGVSTKAYVDGWKIEGSYFGYKQFDYSTVFGMYAYGPFGIYEQVEKSLVPELHFNVMLKRTLVDTIISDLLPLAVIALLLFMILVTSSEQGFALLGAAASVFFGTVFAQARFRTKAPSFQLVYFETFYLLMYAAILAIVIFSLLHLLRFKIRFVQYRNNIIPQILYWPVLLGTIIIITLIYLY